jgi:hypothetical protein
MADSYLTGLTGQLNWSELVSLRAEVRASQMGWASARDMIYEKDGPVGAKAATALPMVPIQRPTERTDTLATANPQRNRALTAVSQNYTEYMDELIYDKEEWDMLMSQGQAQEKVDEAFDSIYSRLLADLTLIFENATATTYTSVRSGTNTSEAIAANAHVTLGATEDNLVTLALTTVNARTVQGLLANQNKIDGTPGFYIPKYVVSGDWGALYTVTQSELASSANDRNSARLLQGVHLPALSTFWAVMSMPRPGGLTIEWAAGRRPYVKPPVLDEYNRVKVVFGSKYAYLTPGYGGSYFSQP